MKIRPPNWYAQFVERVSISPVEGSSHRFARASRALALAFLFFAPAIGAPVLAQWEPLRKDGIHDPKGPAIKLKQEPKDALSLLPRDTTGNQVKWIEALQKGIIKPRPSLKPDVKPNILDNDILLDLNGSMPIVVFPHRRHTEWLDCSNCHDVLFKAQTGSTKFSMQAILNGEQCGVCHGAVSFPLTECIRCHSLPRTTGGGTKALK